MQESTSFRFENFLKKAKEIHPNEKLDYSKSVYINNRTPICIIDHDLKDDGTEYGEFWQTPSNHLKGQSHPLKKKLKISNTARSNQEDIINRFKQVHKCVNLDYSKVIYKGMHTKVCIIDPIYGEYWQEPAVHLKGCGSPKRKPSQITLTTDNFIKKSQTIHGNRYDYSKVSCNGYRSLVTITCPKHGSFSQTAENHLAGKGCPICGYHTSKSEYELRDYIESLIGKDKVIMHDKLLMRNGKELDLVVPDYKLAIEYDGLVWHSEKCGTDRFYHVNKTDACEAIGYRLLHIYEDEWKKHKNIILSKIRYILGCDKATLCIGARKCVIRAINKDSAEDLLNQYHIQGFVGASIYLGAFYNNELVGVMTFKKDSEKRWDLSRFATVDKYRLPGLANKLFKHFVKEYNPDYVKSFLDRRWNNPGNTVYEKLGFVVEEIEKPDYFYVTNAGHDRCHKFGFRKQILHRKYGFPLTMTEREMTEELGYFKIWNCGLVKYSWKKTVDS